MAIRNLKWMGGLNEHEQVVLHTLLEKQIINDTQADEVLQMHHQNHTQLREILGAKGYINQQDYALILSEISENAYFDAPLDNIYFEPELIRKFTPSVMMRYLFCPLWEVEGFITVLVANPDESQVDQSIYDVFPNATIVKMVGTEIFLTRLVNSAFEAEFSHQAVNALKESNPRQSASQVFTRPQIACFGLIIAATLVCLLINFWLTASIAITSISLMYILAIFYKLALSLASLVSDNHHVKEADIHDISDADLPVYSILVPVYKEPEVVSRLLKALSRMDYPSEKLDVLLLMEEDDLETIMSAKAAQPPSFFRFIIVPESLPRTKPKACNYGLHFCRGEFVTIYDAEDIPEPDQLRKAVTAFRNADDNLICVQAALNYFNSSENYLTRMFTLEYSYWFDYLLPGLDRLRLPIPLGGTSNHFKLDKLREMGAWDPYNVTEDADLGIRISVKGYTVGVIPSTTYEEANNAYKNWIRQRSRWIKGYMQTWLVHNRNPLRLIREIGLKDWLSYQFFIGGTFAIFLINPLMWAFFIIWLLFQPVWMSQLFNGWVWDIAFFSLVVGNGLAMVLNMMAAFSRNNKKLLLYALTNPLYWTLHSVAAYMGLYQLITKPFYWEKTNHGLTNFTVDNLMDITDGKS